jgi:hypothetical protein
LNDPSLPDDAKGSISAAIAHYYGSGSIVVIDVLNVLLAFAVALTYPVQFFASVTCRHVTPLRGMQRSCR